MINLSNQLLSVDIKKKLKEFDLDISFEVENGCLGILGASGSGKSMTLKAIAGIITPDNGKISLIGKEKIVFYDFNDKVNMKPQVRNVGYLFQNYALFPNMTVEKNIQIGLSKNQDNEVVHRLIKRFRLEGLEKRYPRQLSGGQQQRVALARILAYEPDVILLDEPFSAMDTFLKEQLRLELANVLKEFNGISILVTHNRDEAFQLCDELLILDKGKIIAKGNTYDVFENPRNIQVARLTGCKNISEIEVIDDYHLKSKDWGIIFEVHEKISSDITHIGIRAHDFEVGDKDSINSFEVINYKQLEMPFEWELTLDNGLWCKIDKHIHNHELVIPKYLKIDPKNIILLRR